MSNDITREDISLTHIRTYIRVIFAPVPYAYQPWFYVRQSSRSAPDFITEPLTSRTDWGTHSPMYP